VADDPVGGQFVTDQRLTTDQRSQDYSGQNQRRQGKQRPPSFPQRDDFGTLSESTVDGPVDGHH